MKILIAAILSVLLSGSTAIGQEAFGSWMIFPGPNPEAADLLPSADPDTVFRIGQIIFDYPIDRLDKVPRPVSDLSNLQSVANAVNSAMPGPALEALVNQQLNSPHKVQFRSATVLDHGVTGLMWNITYDLLPKEGGFSGVPFRYQAVLDGNGRRISPRMSVFDAFFHSPDEGWTCTVLNLPATPTAKDSVLAAEEIRSLATGSLSNRAELADTANATKIRMVYESQERIRIPIAMDSTGKLIHVEVWAVNFSDPSRKERREERLTVWVTEDGRLAEILHLDH